MGAANHSATLWRRSGLALTAGTAIVLSACSASTNSGGGGSSSSGSGPVTLTVAAVDNPQLQDLKTLEPEFEKAHPGIHVNFVIEAENQIRQQITQDVATHSGRFDLATVGTYNVPIYAKTGWLVNLKSYIAANPAYDINDLIPGIAKGLTYQSDYYALPFYGESSFVMYRKDLFQQAGLTMPDHPTWDQIAQFATKLNNPSANMAGICLRGLAGWGEQLAPLDTVVNTFGGRWFDPQWNAQLTSPQFESAVNFYVNLLKTAGEPGAVNSGFTECLNAYNGGHAAMWYDATVGASILTGNVAANSGYAYAPIKVKPNAGWLWTWTLGLESSSKNQDAAWTFMSWATSKDYIKLVGTKLGWNHVPPGTRTSTYSLPEYQNVASAFAPITLDSIAHADPSHATVDPVPYTGVQFVGIPEFEQLGTQVSQQIDAAIAGTSTVSQALDAAQQLAQTVGNNYKH